MRLNHMSSYISFNFKLFSQMKKLLFTLLLLLPLTVSFAQVYQFRHKIWIPAHADVVKVDSVPCDSTVVGGYIVKEEYKLKGKSSEFTVTKVDTLKQPKTYNVLKTVKIDLKSFPGWANIRIDDKDSSIIHLDYWLNTKQHLEEGTKIVIHKKKLECKGIAIEDKIKSRILPADTSVFLVKVSKRRLDSISKLPWYKSTTQIIDVYRLYVEYSG